MRSNGRGKWWVSHACPRLPRESALRTVLETDDAVRVECSACDHFWWINKRVAS